MILQIKDGNWEPYFSHDLRSTQIDLWSRHPYSVSTILIQTCIISREDLISTYVETRK